MAGTRTHTHRKLKCSLVWMCNFLIALTTYAWERSNPTGKCCHVRYFCATLASFVPQIKFGVLFLPCRVCECQGARKTIDTIEEKSVYSAVFLLSSCDGLRLLPTTKIHFEKSIPHTPGLHGPGFFSQPTSRRGGTLYQV